MSYSFCCFILCLLLLIQTGCSQAEAISQPPQAPVQQQADQTKADEPDEYPKNYDEQAKKYVLANHIFQDYALEGIEEEIRALAEPDSESRYLSDRMSIVLRYIYAGKEAQAWSFFDREYNRAGKKEVKSKIESVLKNHPVYRQIYGRSAT